MTPIYQTYTQALNRLKDADQLRSFKQIDYRHTKIITYKNTPCLNLSSNDYLGLATDEALCREFYCAVDATLCRSGNSDLINQYGLGSSSSRLLTGNSILYETLENQICKWYGVDEAALIFNSGYHANLGVISALAGKNDLILSDSLNHASIIDGIRLSKARCMIFPHNDTGRLEALLEQNRAQFENVLIITESLFSMDGDRADLETLVKLKNKYKALLYIDEAHSAGVFGPEGQGLCYQAGLCDQVDILLGTMGKALASHGAYILTRPLIKSYLINTARSLIFSTSLPPVAVSWNLFILERIAEFDKKRKHLQAVSETFRTALSHAGLTTAGDSHIVPVITCDNKKTVEVSDLLFDNGFLAFPIRPPSVPVNHSRIRFSMTSDICFEDIAKIPALIQQHMIKAA